MQMKRNLSGYSFKDKPWMKYYTDEAINASLPECTIYEYLWKNNKEYLNDIALIYFGRKISYGELFDNIDKAVRAFFKIGIKKNDVVILCTLNSPEMVYCIYALNIIGAISAFEYPTVSDKDMSQVIEELNAKAIVILDLFIDKYRIACENIDYVIAISPSASMPFAAKALYDLKNKKLSHNYSYFSSFIKSGDKVIPININIDNKKMSILLHTGGTTGIPKRVALNDANLNSIAYQYKISGMNYSRRDTILHCIPPFTHTDLA